MHDALNNGREVRTESSGQRLSAMRNCGGEKDTMRLLVAILMLTALGGCGGGVPEITGACQTRADGFHKFLTKAMEVGLYRADGETRKVDEGMWDSLENRLKVQLALAAFCEVMTPQGTGTVTLFGLHDGEVKASVVDGRYSAG